MQAGDETIRAGYSLDHLTLKFYWNDFKGDFAEYAMGGPTLEMYVNSYNETHNTNMVVKHYSERDSGYIVREEYYINSDGNSTYELPAKEDFNGIYMKLSRDKADAMWIAEYKDWLKVDMYQAGWYNGSNKTGISPNSVNNYNGFRPIVKLKANLTFTKNPDEGYTIAYQQ